MKEAGGIHYDHANPLLWQFAALCAAHAAAVAYSGDKGNRTSKSLADIATEMKLAVQFKSGKWWSYRQGVVLSDEIAAEAPIEKSKALASLNRGADQTTPRAGGEADGGGDVDRKTDLRDILDEHRNADQELNKELSKESRRILKAVYPTYRRLLGESLLGGQECAHTDAELAEGLGLSLDELKVQRRAGAIPKPMSLLGGGAMVITSYRWSQ